MVPPSISELIYRNPLLYKIIFGLLIGFCIYTGVYISAIALALVYIFRYFHFMGEIHPHYVGATIAFIGLMLHTGVIWPVLVGAGVAILLKVLKSKNYIFWFEIVAGLPYIYYLI